MKISLRKAKVIQEDLRDVLKQLAAPANIKITEYTQDIDAAIATGLENYKSAVANRLELDTLLFYIRQQVGISNAASGIDSLLTQISALTAKIDTLSGISSDTPALSEVKARVARIQETSMRDRGYGFVDHVLVNVLDQTSINLYQDMASEFKKERTKLKDKVLELNIRTEIELDEVQCTLLKQYRVL